MKTENLWAIVPAAGRGSRFDAKLPKQFHQLGGKLVAEITLNKLLELSLIKKIVVVCDLKSDYWKKIKTNDDARINYIAGGLLRAHSVFNGLQELCDLAKDNDWILVHDIVRPCFRREDINKLLKEIQASNVGGILGTRLKDTVKNVENSEDIKATIDREHLWIAQTPQIFRYGLLKKAMQFAFDNALMPTDEAQAIEHHGEKVKIIEGFAGNIKITESLDLKLAGMILSSRGVSCV